MQRHRCRAAYAIIALLTMAGCTASPSTTATEPTPVAPSTSDAGSSSPTNPATGHYGSQLIQLDSALPSRRVARVIVDPDGERFVVRGVVAAYGVFYGDDPADPSGYVDVNRDNLKSDLSAIAARGFNLVRYFVTTDQEPYGGSAAYLAQLDRAVNAARTRGLVVEISNAEDTAPFGRSLAWVASLADRYGDDPGVWLQPSNEPNCRAPERHCSNVGLWYHEQQALIDAIRRTGFANPIVINGIHYSQDFSFLTKRRLLDPAHNLILGAHAYGDNCVDFLTDRCGDSAPFGQVAAARAGWADLVTDYPVIVDEVGADNGPGRLNSPAWAHEFLAWSATWVREDGGSGLIAFNWRWPNANTLTGGVNQLSDTTTLSPWGRLVLDRFVRPTL